MLSVICPIYNEERFIAKCIDGILAQDYPKDDMEVLFVDGMSTDNTRLIISNYSKQYPFIKLIDNPDRIVPKAMNVGIRKAHGDIIIRLDGHCEYPVSYFSSLIEHLSKLNCDNVGGVVDTKPYNENNVSYAISEVLKNPFGVGNSLFRIGTRDITKVDTVPFGCFRRSIFEEIGVYDEDLIRNQDDELNARIIKNGGTIYLVPSIEITYFARDKISKVWKMYYQYGLFKPLVNKKLGNAATLRQFVPPLFVLGIVVGIPLCFVSIWIMYFFCACVALYLIMEFIQGIKSAKKTKRIMMVFLMPYVFFNVHLAYGLGYWIGLFKVLFHRPFVVKANR